MRAVAWQEARLEAIVGLDARRCKAGLSNGVVFLQEQEKDCVFVFDARE